MDAKSLVKEMTSYKPNSFKVVYLDQKCWIEIAKIYYGKPSQQERQLIEKLFKASENSQVIFPLSILHLEETMRISDTKRKSQLASLMIKLSKGYSFQPYYAANIRAEIFNVILKKLGIPPINIRNYVLKQGISNLIGAKPELIQKKGAESSELPEDLKKKLLYVLESLETMEFALKQGPIKSIEQSNKDTVKTMEKIRHELLGIKDNNLRRRVFLARNLMATVIPELAKILFENNLPKDFIIKENPTRKDIEEFLDNIPTALCLFTLIFRRDQQLQRPIQVNDFSDINFLTLALPYSDIVVTENMWVSIVRDSKLDRKCNTIILSSISELAKYL